jgi:outer membrane protein TolC
VLQQSIALYSSRTTLLQAQADRLVQRVNLHLALGGAFESTAPVRTSDADDRGDEMPLKAAGLPRRD